MGGHDVESRDEQGRRRAGGLAGGVLVALLLVALGGVAVAALKGKSDPFDVASGATAEGEAGCKPGQTALAGGFTAPLQGGTGPSMLAVDSTREGTDGWRFRATNLGADGEATAYVYCHRRPRKLTTETAQVTVGANQLDSATAQCPVGRNAVAGGFDFPDDKNTNLVASKRVGVGGWEVTLFNATGGSRTYDVFVYCGGGRSLKQAEKTIFANENERYGQSAVARCKRGREARSGGFETQYEGEGELADLGIVHQSRRKGKRAWKVTAFAPLGDPQVTAYAYCKR
jgi:hypothetical protein